jgi:hypothetical protein
MAENCNHNIDPQKDILSGQASEKTVPAFVASFVERRGRILESLREAVLGSGPGGNLPQS